MFEKININVEEYNDDACTLVDFPDCTFCDGERNDNDACLFCDGQWHDLID